MSGPYVPSTNKGLFAYGLAWIVATIVAIMMIVAVLSAATWGWSWLTSPLSGKVSARQQINSGPFRIAAYNYFFDLCASVQTLEGQLDAQAAELIATTIPEDRARIEANIAGLRGARADAINQYNVDARKGYTIGQFKSSSLPYQLSTATFNGKDGTSCGG